jgi:hypothetical protein
VIQHAWDNCTKPNSSLLKLSCPRLYPFPAAALEHLPGYRYIYTRLAGLTRHVFNKADDKLLTYLNEEGQSIEPEW